MVGSTRDGARPPGGSPLGSGGVPDATQRRLLLYLAATALLVAVVALGLSVLGWYRTTGLLQAHNDLVRHHKDLVRHHNDLIEKLNKEKERTSTGAVLDALGVPAGKVIGDVLDASKPPVRRDPRSRRRSAPTEKSP